MFLLYLILSSDIDHHHKTILLNQCIRTPERKVTVQTEDIWEGWVSLNSTYTKSSLVGNFWWEGKWRPCCDWAARGWSHNQPCSTDMNLLGEKKNKQRTTESVPINFMGTVFLHSCKLRGPNNQHSFYHPKFYNRNNFGLDTHEKGTGWHFLL